MTKKTEKALDALIGFGWQEIEKAPANAVQAPQWIGEAMEVCDKSVVWPYKRKSYTDNNKQSEILVVGPQWAVVETNGYIATVIAPEISLANILANSLGYIPLYPGTFDAIATMGGALSVYANEIYFQTVHRRTLKTLSLAPSQTYVPSRIAPQNVLRHLAEFASMPRKAGEGTTSIKLLAAAAGAIKKLKNPGYAVPIVRMDFPTKEMLRMQSSLTIAETPLIVSIFIYAGWEVKNNIPEPANDIENILIPPKF